MSMSYQLFSTSCFPVLSAYKSLLSFDAGCSRIDELRKRYDRDEMVRVDWLDKLTFRVGACLLSAHACIVSCYLGRSIYDAPSLRK